MSCKPLPSIPRLNGDRLAEIAPIRFKGVESPYLVALRAEIYCYAAVVNGGVSRQWR